MHNISKVGCTPVFRQLIIDFNGCSQDKTRNHLESLNVIQRVMGSILTTATEVKNKI
jgi:hypothetical protein